jgi:hypothetical protein
LKRCNQARSWGTISWIRLVWLVIVAALSLMPLSVKQSLGTTGPLHAFGHIALFTITAIMFCLPVSNLFLRCLAGTGVLLFGTVLEFLQWLIYHNLWICRK